jgi:thiosulfate/3-mercaptopyruvate sulfurtransferase
MSPVVDNQWLHDHLDDEDVLILDASPRQNKSGLKPEFENLRIRGARYFDLEHDFSKRDTPLPNMLPAEKDFQHACRMLGIKKSSIIIVYDNLGVYTSPRVWWMFKTMGHESVSVLDGGLSGWIHRGFPTEITEPKYSAIGDFTAKFNSRNIASCQTILYNLERRESIIIDAREQNRFNGSSSEPRKGIRSGHIPGSFNIPFQRVLINGHFKSAEELKKVFREIPIKDKPLIFSCGSGVTACIVLLAAELISDSVKKVYDGSWAEWGGNENLPLQRTV